MKFLARLLAAILALGIVRAETTLTVSAAASLAPAMAKARALYAAAQPDVKLTFNFGGSGVLQQQIAAGAPVDVFISAGGKQMDSLEREGRLLPGTRRDLLTNQLFLITPKDEAHITTLRDLAKAEIKRIAIGDPNAAPAGAYALDAIKALGISRDVEPKLVRMLDVRQVLTAVETGNVDAGFVYLTDARSSEKVRIAATAETPSPIVYPIAVIRNSQQPEAAKAFADFLASAQARAVFEAFGFGTPK